MVTDRVHGGVAGLVETFGDREVRGWAVRDGEGLPRIEVRITGQPILADESWHERSDVCAVHGSSARRCGFRLRFHDVEAALLRRARLRGDAIEVTADGVPLALPAPPAPGLSLSDWLATADAPSVEEPLESEEEEPVAFEPTANADVVPEMLGIVESLSPDEITGWAFDPLGTPVSLIVAVDDDIVDPQRVTWVPRVDVQAVKPGVSGACGFVISLSAGASRRAREALAQGGTILVLANGAVLDLAPAALAPLGPLPEPDPQGGRAALERAARFVISGWAMDADGRPAAVTVRANGEPLECRVSRFARRDITRSLNVPDADIGFDVELPANVWNRGLSDGPILVDILADEVPIDPQPLHLTRTLASAWVSQLAGTPEGTQEDARRLLALEHVHAANLLPMLDGRGTLLMRWFARRMDLDDFLYGDGGSPVSMGEAPRESEDEACMRAALQELNGRLAADRAPAFPHLKQVLEGRKLTQEVHEWMLHLGAQLTCSTGEFLKMRELTDLAYFQKFADAIEPHRLSLALAGLAAEDRVEAATIVLRRLARHLDAGWLHTQCVRFAVESVERLEAESAGRRESGEAFREALIELLDALQGDWFGRLHDVGLVEALVEALSSLDRSSSAHGDALARAAIRIFGLSPTFWALWSAREHRPRHDLLERAEAAWISLSRVRSQPADTLREVLPTLLEPLAFFHEHRNPDALQFTREILAVSLGDVAPLGIENQLAERLIAADRREAVRMAAFPDEQVHRVWLESPPIPTAGAVESSDTLVVIVSCRRDLDARVGTIRRTWLPRLAAAGIPHLVVVGDGHDHREGDVLALEVGDGYADRPQKTLRMFDWVYRNTQARFVLRIEDDCQLDVARYFGAGLYRRHAYYGRVVRREPGDLARAGLGWHAPDAGKLDRSPEPSTACDGRLGYCLSREAIASLLDAAQSDEGRRLIGVSTREDKLVGDLLASVGILPSEEGYAGFLQVRTGPDAVPVCLGDDASFDISGASPSLVSHRGRELSDADLASPALFPKRIWPTVAAPALVAQSNALQLLTPPARARAVLRADHAVVAVMRNERELIPHFLAHYRKLGLASFLVADNGSTDGTREYLLDQPDVVLYSAGAEYRNSHYGVSWQQAMLGNHCLGKWVVLADADEFLVFDDSEHRPFDDLVAQADYEGADAVITYMIDLYPRGSLDQATFASAGPFEVADHFDAAPLIDLHIGSGRYSNAANHVNALRHRVAPTRIDAYTSQKCAVIKYFPWVRVSEGVHYAANVKPSRAVAFFAHFKYHAGFARKVAEEVRRRQHFNDAEEYRHFARILGPGKGLYAEGVSQRYRSSDDFMALFEPGRVRHPEPDEGWEFRVRDDSARLDAV